MLEFLKFNIGGYCGYTNVEIRAEDNLLRIKTENIPIPISDEETLMPIKKHEKWLRKLEALYIGKWKSTYRLENMVIYDGEQWNLEYKEVGKRCRHISGDNAYPENWIDFLAVMNEIVPMDVPMQIDVFDFIYHGKRQLFAESNLKLQKTDKKYSEHIRIDRNKKSFVYNRMLENGYEINNEYKMLSGISDLLDELEEYFEDCTDCSFNVNEDVNFTLCLNYHNGENKSIKGPYNRYCLPEYWEDAIKRIEQYLSIYGFLGDTFNSDIYGRDVKGNEVIYCTVNFNDNGKGFYYQTDDDSLAIGEKVIVPCGKDNTKREATIKRIEYFTKDTVPFPIANTKKIIGRKLNKPFLDKILDVESYKAVKEYFISLPKINNETVYKFLDRLYSMECMVSNYYDYLKFEPMDVNKEMQRIDTVDIKTAFAILTMVFREDYFCNGSILQRIEDGTLDKIIGRIRLLFNEN